VLEQGHCHLYDCGGPVHKLLSSPAIQFKGSGFYITDYPKGDKGSAPKSDGGKGDRDAKADKRRTKIEAEETVEYSADDFIVEEDGRRQEIRTFSAGEFPLALAVGILGAALNVRYRDVGTLTPILLQVWMFVSPLVYSSSIVPERSRWLYSLNPLVGLIDGFRASLFNLPLPWTSIIVSVLVTWPLLIFSIHIFRKLEVSFADDV
jgi:hypothetical protein